MNWTGLAAKAWDPSGGDEPQEDHDFIRKVLEKNPGPALDVGCDIQVKDGWTDEDFAERHSSMVFVARKPID